MLLFSIPVWTYTNDLYDGDYAGNQRDVSRDTLVTSPKFLISLTKQL